MASLSLGCEGARFFQAGCARFGSKDEDTFVASLEEVLLCQRLENYFEAGWGGNLMLIYSVPLTGFRVVSGGKHTHPGVCYTYSSFASLSSCLDKPFLLFEDA